MYRLVAVVREDEFDGGHARREDGHGAREAVRDAEAVSFDPVEELATLRRLRRGERTEDLRRGHGGRRCSQLTGRGGDGENGLRI